MAESSRREELNVLLGRDAVRIYYRTTAGQAALILRNGFLNELHRGVTWPSQIGVRVFDQPIQITDREGGCCDTWITCEVPEPELIEYEWLEQGKRFREFVVPAALLNRFIRPPQPYPRHDHLE